jgi:very-short-patch-repair endonuclease
MTDAEKKLWALLRNKQFDGVKFRRQQPIGSYIVDFVCFETKLVVELDGGQHASQQVYDTKRTAFLHEQGFVVVRFWNQDVLTNPDGVYEVLKQALANAPSPLVGEGWGEGASAQGEYSA